MNTPRTDREIWWVGFKPDERLEAENAELRNLLRDSLEWLDDYGMRMSGTSNLVSRIETALRKEAQRWGDDQIMRQHLSEGGTPT